MGFKAHYSPAASIIAGVELSHMIANGKPSQITHGHSNSLQGWLPKFGEDGRIEGEQLFPTELAK